MPILMATLISLVLVGVLLFQVARGSDLRARAQTAADAAALAGAREIRSQLEALAMSGRIDVAAIDLGRVRSAASDYAGRNGARLTKLERLGIDVRVAVVTEEKLGGPAQPLGSEESRASARARASFSVISSVGEAPEGAAGDVSGTLPTGGSGRVPERAWDELEAQIRNLAAPANIIALGRFLQRHGFQVGENAAFGPVGRHAPRGFHYQYGNRGAIDVNFGCGCGNLYPPEVGAIEPIVPKIRALGFNTIWNVAPGDHQDHLHVDVGTPGPLSGPGLGGPFAGSDDVLVALRLVPLEGPPSRVPFGLGGPLQTIDPAAIRASQREIARRIFEVGKRRGVSDKLMLAAFETAWVESKFTNVAPGQGDRDSVGVFQQRPSMGWGSPSRLLDVEYAAARFFTAAASADRGQPAGALADDVQRSCCPWRYPQAEGIARIFLEQAGKDARD